MTRFVLPQNINADGLLPFVAQLAEVASARPTAVEIDFTWLRRVSPSALVVLTAQVDAWRKGGVAVVPRGLGECSILGYLQRMDLLEACAFSQPETFARHNAKGRFVPVRPVDDRVEEMGSDMALCVAPGGDEFGHPLAGPYDLVWYVLTEMGNNVRQHSGGRGFASAQVGQAEGLVRLAIADNGRGILGSFREAGFSWSAQMDDAAAILKALEPRVSSKGSPYNEGVGLTLTSKMAELAEAWMLIVSGTGAVRLNPGKVQTRIEVGTLPNGARYAGTLVALTFRQHKAHDFALLLDAAKRESGLLRQQPQRGRFAR